MLHRINGGGALVWTATCLCWLAACGPRVPEPPSATNLEQVSATRRAVRIPYEQYVLLRSDRQLVALEVWSRSPRGEHIGYRWSTVPVDDAQIDWAQARHGEGETSEQPYDGVIAIPGLRLTWSRGSAKAGWLYWPDDGRPLEVCSKSWAELEDVDPGAGGWLDQRMFRE